MFSASPKLPPKDRKNSSPQLNPPKLKSIILPDMDSHYELFFSNQANEDTYPNPKTTNPITPTKKSKIPTPKTCKLSLVLVRHSWNLLIPAEASCSKKKKFACLRIAHFRNQGPVQVSNQSQTQQSDTDGYNRCQMGGCGIYPALGLDGVLVVDVAAEGDEVEVLAAEGAVVRLPAAARLHLLHARRVRVVEPHVQIWANTHTHPPPPPTHQIAAHGNPTAGEIDRWIERKPTRRRVSLP